ncbi:MAG: acyl-protein synthetase [Lachnospiraceae bacterium]|nr:acyl-protein synthetase [Lachnospiraceae bacterium]
MIDDFHKRSPYSLMEGEKTELLVKELKDMLEFHSLHCEQYGNILHALGYDRERLRKIRRLGEFPFLPVRIFKELELKSIPDREVFKVMKSSGTTGQLQSQIFLDKETAILQQKVLLRLLGNFVGTKRLPMLVIDTPQVIRDRKMFSARGATIMGLDFAAKKMVFALNDDMSLNVESVQEFLRNYGKDTFLIFGFTFMVWQSFYNEIEKRGLNLDCSKGYLLTGGGWKKLQSESVTPERFKQRGRDLCGLRRFMDHYSMAEQSGCIYAECEYGHLHASIYSDILIRHTEDFSLCQEGEKGMVQVLSVLPRSYPGNSLLTEDEGMIVGKDDCPCGRKGKYIKIFGRIKNAEIRGCSDTYAAGK